MNFILRKKRYDFKLATAAIISSRRIIKQLEISSSGEEKSIQNPTDQNKTQSDTEVSPSSQEKASENSSDQNKTKLDGDSSDRKCSEDRVPAITSEQRVGPASDTDLTKLRPAERKKVNIYLIKFLFDR